MGPALPSGGAAAACVRARMVLNQVLGPNDSVMARKRGTSAWSVLRTQVQCHQDVLPTINARLGFRWYWSLKAA